jgi:diguanylate cyclase (GGDEF)-like protein
LVIIAISGVVAVLASTLRERRDSQLRAALTAAAGAAAMHRQATHDELTGLLNRRGFYERCAERSETTPLSIALLDCDDFKQVNDEFGHLVGDEFLRSAAGRIAGDVAATDLVARWGGDEFLIALDLPPELAQAVFDRVLASATQVPITTSAGPLALKLSAGVTQWQPGESLDQALGAADRALYLAKNAGGGNSKVG